ncbi:DUF397 domain-containing protein [Nocardiopsis metallicus]|uniref:DUF397 domain-containing protein n=1 Tax=Nocardiopsis metallicus TaxID=179819 RepID=A0A840WL46_9ACTN|nr:DUF397 domain-containing protein [Nocardiopsis metallicus]MBB5490828.1 hypothetical protein [Nocardiopsis metallicus]
MAEWFKSSYSGGDNNCVEVAHNPWHTAIYTNDRGACVEVSEGPITGIRDTKNRELGALFFEALEWRAFLSPNQHSVR